ncbi:MAG TPA: PAS domain S-box protein, partial [Candidatus Sulfotelmatobacter sp.]|nr:PAS domain S-box protein [Candidatus Sulfotelmatobacter sp.]
AGSLEAGDPAFIESLRQKKYLVRPQDINWVAGYTLLSDLFGQPAAVVQVKVPRNIYRQGTVTTVYLAFILGTIGLLLVLGALLLLEKLILAPLTGLSSEVVRIGQHGDLTSRLSISGADELAALGRQINRMLNALTTAQTQQNESAKKFEKLFAATPDAIYLEKLDGTIVDCNKAASEATGYAKEELLKMNAADLVPAATAGLFPELVGDLHSTGSFFVVAENRRKDGTIFPVESSGRLIEIGGEKYAFVVARDISDRQRAEGQLREKLKELEDFHDTVIGRELKMIELEKEIDSLRRELEKGTKRP